MTALVSFLVSLLGIAIAVCVLFYRVYLTRRKNKYSPFTEKLLRSPGYTLGQQLDKLKDDLIGPYLGVAFSPILLFAFYRTLNFTAFVVTTVIVIGLGAICLKRLLALFKDAQVLRLGLDGEVYTGQELNFLMRQGAWVFHDIPYQYGNIDHVVVSKGGIFVVETKAVRKPASGDGKRQSKVSVSGGKIYFPHHATQAPIEQAKRHAQHVRNYLLKKTGRQYPVTPVVALPGWYVSTEKTADYLVINPKRGGGLRAFVEKDIIPINDAEVAANHIEEFARSIQSKTDLNDPDAHKRYDFFLNRKREDDKM